MFGRVEILSLTHLNWAKAGVQLHRVRLDAPVGVKVGWPPSQVRKGLGWDSLGVKPIHVSTPVCLRSG